jgi:flavin reductase (DIM6/NTAB) family NADH-FMN oxidoreductase RutF
MTTTPITPSILYFGTPVVLLSTVNGDGTPNLAPMSSAWALGDTLVLGMSVASQTAANLLERPEVAVNLPSAPLWESVERLAPTTGRDPVPEHKRGVFRHERDKFAAAGLTPLASQKIAPPRVAECPLQFEAEAVRQRPDLRGEFMIIEARVLLVHAHPEIVVPGTSHIDTAAWNPLIYSFRHYFGLAAERGRSFRAEV